MSASPNDSKWLPETGIRKFVFAVVAGIASAALFYLGTGLHPICWLLWVAPVPVLTRASGNQTSAAIGGAPRGSLEPNVVAG